ncbi:hypothetical protein SDRG_09607 [Saprolegnia diclina VS20]|uniref:DFDF domain-containing protein n=1 Tax=Saprolegnia diclina (strain VS20) TaxID=1156394 RepID=T0RLC5_SAPDV|nr:hypothetical protein SDRG_09607 [Saprolegnia diclina VS20]EQC33088.1 hypothetical protein SDRG_09607 [Saprolegnia diclina VS20]|eukprot:XP_008613774.1 hypothetical protein SDRG_09607 [Saprolegnia diclina VS20]
MREVCSVRLKAGVAFRVCGTMAESKSEGIPYIGSRISLISKTDIRYEGLLFNIDTRQSMVALQNVRSFGTEGRRPDHIPPSDTVLQYATFKASEIKDLHVCEAAAPPPPPMMPPHAMPPAPAMHYQPPPPLPRQPEVAQPTAARPTSPTNAYAAPTISSTLLTPGAMSTAYSVAAQQVQQQQQKQHQQQHAPSPRQPERQDQGAQNGGNRTIPGMGGHLLKRKERRVGADTGMTDSEIAAEFDFAVGLTDFNKEDEYSKMSMTNAEAVRPVIKGSYQKSSFFDTISCDALDRLEGVNGRLRAHEERKLNTETFGAVGLNNRRGYRGNRNNGNGNGNGNGGGNRNRNGGNGYPTDPRNYGTSNGNSNGSGNRDGNRDGNGNSNRNRNRNNGGTGGNGSTGGNGRGRNQNNGGRQPMYQPRDQQA